MKFRLAALSINSMPMSTTMALRRVSAPANPTQNSAALTSRYSWSGVIGETSKLQTPNSNKPSTSKLQKNALLQNRAPGERSRVGVWSSEFGVSLLFLLHGDDDGADHGRGEQQTHHF